MRTLLLAAILLTSTAIRTNENVNDLMKASLQTQVLSQNEPCPMVSYSAPFKITLINGAEIYAADVTNNSKKDSANIIYEYIDKDCKIKKIRFVIKSTLISDVQYIGKNK